MAEDRTVVVVLGPVVDVHLGCRSEDQVPVTGRTAQLTLDLASRELLGPPHGDAHRLRGIAVERLQDALAGASLEPALEVDVGDEIPGTPEQLVPAPAVHQDRDTALGYPRRGVRDAPVQGQVRSTAAQLLVDGDLAVGGGMSRVGLEVHRLLVQRQGRRSVSRCGGRAGSACRPRRRPAGCGAAPLGDQRTRGSAACDRRSSAAPRGTSPRGRVRRTGDEARPTRSSPSDGRSRGGRRSPSPTRSRSGAPPPRSGPRRRVVVNRRGCTGFPPVRGCRPAVASRATVRGARSTARPARRRAAPRRRRPRRARRCRWGCDARRPRCPVRCPATARTPRPARRQRHGRRRRAGAVATGPLGCRVTRWVPEA